MDIAVIGGNAWFLGSLARILEDGALRLTAAADSVAEFIRAMPGARRADRPAAADARPAPATAPREQIVILACTGAESELGPLIRWSRRYHPELRVVAKFATLRPDLVRDAIQAGAWGCFSAGDAPETVTAVLDTVAQGRVSFPFVDLSVLRDDPFEQLTRRERDVLRALAEGWTNTQISARLGISANTVKYHLRLIYDKLGVGNRAMAVAKYMQRMPG